MQKIPSPYAGGAAGILANFAEIQKQTKAASQSYYGFKGKRGPFLTPRELAAAFKVSTKTLERWRKNGGGPPYTKIANKHIRYPIAGLEQWVADNIVSAPPLVTE